MGEVTGKAATYKEFFATMDLSGFVDEYGPGNTSIRLDYSALAEFDDHLADKLRTQPQNGLKWATEGARAELEQRYDGWYSNDRRVNIRVRNLPKRHVYRVGKQRTRHLGQLIGLEAEVVDTEPVKPFAENAAFECVRCGSIARVPQRPGKMYEPGICPGCEDSKTYRFNQQQSTMVDHQRVIVIPPNSTLEEPPGLIVFLRDDLCDTVEDGDQVAFTGRLDTFYQQKESVLSTYLLACDLDEEEYAEVDADTQEVGDRVADYISTAQNDGVGFGVPREDVVDDVAGERYRESEVEETIDELVEAPETDVKDVNGKLAIVETDSPADEERDASVVD